MEMMKDFSFTESMQVHDGGIGFRGSAVKGATVDSKKDQHLLNF